MFEIVFHIAEIALLGWGIYILKFQTKSELKFPSQKDLTNPVNNPTGDDEFWAIFDSASGKFMFNRCEFHPDMDELLASEKFRVEKTCRQ